MMKKCLFSLILMSVAIAASAQRKRYQAESGFNYPLSLRKDGYKESRVGFTFGGFYNYRDSPISVGLRFGFESYTIVQEQYMNIPFDGRSFSVVPLLRYNFFLSPKTIVYTGGGVGLSVDNENAGLPDDGRRLRLLVSPLIGIELWGHISLSAQYHFTAKDRSRLMVGVSYVY